MQFRRAWVEENCSNSVLNIITNGYIHPFHLKPKQTKATTKMETSHRLKQAKSIPEDRKVQNGDPRVNKNVLKYR